MPKRHPLESREEAEQRRKDEWRRELEWRKWRTWKEQVDRARKQLPGLYAMVETERFESWYKKVTGEEFRREILASPWRLNWCVGAAVRRSRWKKKRDALGLEITSGGRPYTDNFTKRRVAQKIATPPWADMQKIAEVYTERDRLNQCREGLDRYEVDHIVPILGKNVCGLHCHMNMQLLTARENRMKSNDFCEVEYARATGYNLGNVA